MKHYYKCNYQKNFRCGLESPCFYLQTLSWTTITPGLFLTTTLFRNYFVINLHFKTKLNQNDLHGNSAYLIDLIHSFADLQFSEMMDKSKSVMNLPHKLIYLKFILCSQYNRFTTYGARLIFSGYFSHHEGRSISQNVTSLNLLLSC